MWRRLKPRNPEDQACCIEGACYASEACVAIEPEAACCIAP